MKYVYLEDDSLLTKRNRAIEIFREIRRRHLVLSDVNGVNITHMCRRAPSGLVPDEELLEEMRVAFPR